MAKETVKNPFDIFAESGTRHIEVKALNNAKVEIKTSLTVEQEQNIKATCFRNQETVGGRIVPNESDLSVSKTLAVSYLLVEPKMSLAELGKLNGATEAIVEIYDSYQKYKADKKGN